MVRRDDALVDTIVVLSSLTKVTSEMGRCRPSLRQSPRVAPRSKALVKRCLMVALALFFFPPISPETAVEISAHVSK